MKNKHRIVEGGQLFMHRMRMLKQTMKLVLALSMTSIAILLITLISIKNDWYACYLLLMQYWAKLKMSLKIIMPHSYSYIDLYTKDLTLVRVKSTNFLNDPYVHSATTKVLATLNEVLAYSPFLVLLSIAGSFLFFGVFSNRQRSNLTSKEILRGKELVAPKELSSILYSYKKASDLKLDKLPLVKDKETSHILITGTTGSGKTNCFHTLLPQIRHRKNKAVVIDMTGDLVSKYYREGYDIILNPTDERSLEWNLWDECQTDEDLESFVGAFIPQNGNRQDPFWENAARSVLSTAIKKMKIGGDLDSLSNLLIRSDIQTYHDYFEGSDAASYTDKMGGKTTLSIRSALCSHIECLKYISSKQGSSLSIKEWIREEEGDQWLFISSIPSQRQLLRPLMSAWLNIAINSIMSLEIQPQRRIWLVVDELPSLNNVPALKMGLAEFRKYGGCILAGIQNFPQLAEIYGESVSRSMLDLFNTKILFRTGDPTTSQWAAKVLGETEYAESQENLSFGANSIRDGVSLARSEKIKQIVLPSEIANLNDLECVIKYPGDYPSTRLLMKYKHLPDLCPAYIPIKDNNKHKVTYPQNLGIV